MAVQTVNPSRELQVDSQESCQVKALQSVINEFSAQALNGLNQLPPAQVEEIIADARIDACCGFDQFPAALLHLRDDALQRMRNQNYGCVNFGIDSTLVGLERALEAAE